LSIGDWLNMISAESRQGENNQFIDGGRMGFLKGSIKVVSNVVTLGEAARLEEAKKAYQQRYDTYQAMHADAKSYEYRIQEHLKSIGMALTKAKSAIDKAEAVLNKSMGTRTVALKEQLDALPEFLAAVEARNSETDEECQAFVANIAHLIKIIRPWGILGLAKQKVYVRFGKNPFSDKQVLALQGLNSRISEFLLWFQNGKPVSDAAQPVALIATEQRYGAASNVPKLA
jgi:hypothetical protein